METEIAVTIVVPLETQLHDGIIVAIDWMRNWLNAMSSITDADKLEITIRRPY